MKYGFIGCGHMGSAIARALSKTTRDFMVTDRSGKAKPFAQDMGVAYGDNVTAARECNRLFLCVKPQMMEAVLSPLAPILREKKPLLITMAAGLEMAKIEAFAGTPLPVIRIMPNTPVAVGKGMIPYCANSLVQESVLQDFLKDMRFCGALDAIGEAMMDAASALSGSGPAYLYLYMAAMAEGAAACGLPKDKALRYAAETMAGAAEMLLASQEDPYALADAVCSPGGSTIEGVKVLRQQDMAGTVSQCIQAAYRRNQELGK